MMQHLFDQDSPPDPEVWAIWLLDRGFTVAEYDALEFDQRMDMLGMFFLEATLEALADPETIRGLADRFGIPEAEFRAEGEKLARIFAGPRPRP